MEIKLLDKLADSFSIEMPVADSLDKYLDEILGAVRPWGEDLREERFFLNKGWLEIRDDENFHDTILHFFNDDNEYLRSVDGDVSGGTWRHLEGANKFLIRHGKEEELYDLAFLDGEFFVLQKHGDQVRMGQRKYFVMLVEKVGKKLEWKDAMEYLFNKYRNNNNFFITVIAIILVIVAIVVILS